MRVSRLVILPDYQGIGLGTRFLDAVCDMYADRNIVSIVTSAKNMIHALQKSDVWKARSYSVNPKSGKKAIVKGSHRTNVKTARFVYVGHKGD